MRMEFYNFDIDPATQAVRLTLHHLGIKYVGKNVDLPGHENRTPSFLAMNPVGKVPVIKDGDFVLSESRPIAIYLCVTNEPPTKERKLYPSEPKDMAKVNMMLSIDHSNFLKVFAYANLQKMYYGQKLEEDKQCGVCEVLALLETFLCRTEFIATDYLTIADFFTLSTVKILDYTPFDGWCKYPRLSRWKNKMEALPCYEESMGKYFRKYSEKFARNNTESQDEEME